MPVIRAILFSFGFHILLLIAVVALVPLTYTPPTVVEFPVEVAILTPEKKPEKERTIVRDAFVPDRLKAPDDETMADFLSQKRQRVKEQMRAANSGMTENRSNLADGKDRSKNERGLKHHEETARDKDGYRTVDISKDLAEMNRLDKGFSTVGESLPTDVKIGSFTALNSDRYVFYTFYARIEEQVRFRWVTHVMNAINQFDSLAATNFANEDWVTQVEFLLDPSGVVKKAILMKSSGLKVFDEASIRAFVEARMFPNPPKEMVQDDGFIHLKYSFLVNYRPPNLVNRN